MRYLALLLFSISLFAQFPATSVTADKITPSGARITWTTGSANNSYVIWGTVSGTLNKINGGGGAQVTTAHQWFVSNAPPNTLIYYRVGANSGSMDATEYSFTTSAQPTPYPAVPVAPAAVNLPAVPSLTGTSLTTDATCSTLQAHLTTLKALDGNLNHELHIPSGAVCAFNSGSTTGDANQPALTIPAKTGSNPTGTGVINVVCDATLPPAGSRITSAWNTCTFVNTNVGISEIPTASAPSNCILGQMYWDYNVALTAAWALKECTVEGTTTYGFVAKTTFTGTPPTPCTVNTWYQKTDASDVALGIYRCDNLGRILQIQLYPTESIRFAATKGWRFTGIDFDALRWPTSSPPAWLTSNSSPGGSRYAAAINFKNAVNVTLDRCRFRGGSYPNRFQQLLISETGTNIYVANSSFEGIAYALTAVGGGGEPSNQGGEFTLFNLGGGQYYLFDNNYVEYSGFGVFGTDDLTTYASDVRITRNHFYIPDTYWYGGPSSNGHFYHNRHNVELKRGVRWLIQGNYMQGGFASTNQGAAIAISPRPGTSGATVLMTDIDILDNTITDHTSGIYVAGHNDNDASQAQVTQRVRILNNNIYGVNGDRYATGWGQKFGPCFTTLYGGEDLIVENNTCNQVSNTGQYPASFLSDLTGAAWGALRFVYNLTTHVPVVNNTTGISRANDVNRGTATLAASFQQYVATPNVFINLNSQNTADYPAGNLWPASLAAVGFYDTAAFNYRLKFSSTYAGTGAGANLDVIRASQGEVYNQRALSIAATTATIAYTAPAPTISCTIRIPGISDVVDTVASRFRATAVTGLTGLTAYATATVYCSGSAGVVVPSFTTL